MNKKAPFITGILLCFFLLFLGCDEATTQTPITAGPTTVMTNIETTTSVSATETTTDIVTTVITVVTTIPVTTVTEVPTTITTELTTEAPIFSEDEALALLGARGIDLEALEGTFMLPKSISDVALEWEIGDANPYVVIDDSQTEVEVEILPVELGDTDQQITISITASALNQEVEVVLNATIKARTVPLSDFYNLPDGAEVKVGGVVYAIARVGYSGYFIHDKSGCAFVYASSDDVELGDEIIINAEKDIYYNMHEIKYDSLADITFIAADKPGPEYETSSVSEILDGPQDYTGLSKNVIIQAKVIRKYENYMTNFYFQDLVTGEDVFIYYQSAQDIAGLYDEQYVEAKITVYDYNNSTGTFSVFLSNNMEDITAITPNLSDAEKAEAVSFYLERLYQNKVVSDNIEFVLTDPNWDSEISWTSGNPDVVTTTGQVTFLDEETDVVMTAAVHVGIANIEVPLTIKVSPITIETLKSINEWQIANPLLTKEVAFEAVVIATRGTSGYFVNQNGYGYYVKGNDIDVQPGDLVRVIGVSKYSRQPYLDSKRLQKIVSSDNALPSPQNFNATAVAEMTPADTFYNSYIELEGTVLGIPSQYGYTYSLQVGEKVVTIHAASNTAGFSYLIGSRISLTCFVNRINSDNVNWEIFVVNRDGDITVDETNQAKLAMGITYLADLFIDDADITTDIRLPEVHPAIQDVTYAYQSSNELVFTNAGLYLYPATDTPITLTVTVGIGGLTQDVVYDFTVKACLPDHSSDLMFTFLLHGITNNKIFAIYNGTGHDVDLATYKVFAVQNSGIGSNAYTIDGRNVTGILTLSGTLASGETLIVYHVSTNVVILNQIPETVLSFSSPNQNGVAQFNGKDGDMLVLQRSGVIVDQIGSFEKINSQGGQTSWEKIFFGSKMLIRISDQPTPALNWSDSDTILNHWAVYPAGEAPDYPLPSVAFDFLNGALPVVPDPE